MIAAEDSGNERRMKPLFRLFVILLVFLFDGEWLGAEPDASDGYQAQIRVQPLLRTTTTTAGQPVVYPSTENPEVTAVLVEIPSGAQTGWHKHPFPCYAYILSGALTVEMEGGKSHHFQAGDALVESVNVLHNGKNTGTEPVKLVMFVTGEKEKPFTIKAPE